MLKNILKELFKEKTRMILTILAIAWGTFAISSMLAIGEGLRITFAKAVKNAGQNVLTISGGRTSKEYLGTHTNQPILLRKKDLVTIAHLPEIAAITPTYNFTIKIQHQKKSVNAQINAVNANYATIHQIQTIPGGRFISPIDNQHKNAVIVLGTKTLEDLFPNNPNPTGKYLRLGNNPFLIVGVMKKKTQLVATESPDAFSNWIPTKTYELYANPYKIDMISVTYKTPQKLEQTKNQIQKIIALNNSVDPNDDSIVNFSDVAKQQEKITKFFIGMQLFLGLVGCLTLIVAAVGIANVMYASVKRSTHDIGIKMAVGARTYHILFHYIMEALAATFIGGLLGLMASAFLVYALNFIPMHGRLFDNIGQPRPVLSLFVVTIVIFVLGLVGFFAGLFPALQASKVDPSEALIYE